MMPARSELQRAFLVAGSTCPVVRLEPGSGMPLGRAVIAIGAFDGFHIGHQTLIAKTIADARERGAGAFVVTFDPDPDCVVGPGPAPRLLCLDDRLRALAASGVDGVVVVPFTPELARLDHAAFFEQVLLPSLDVCAVHVGSDFRMVSRCSATRSCSPTAPWFPRRASARFLPRAMWRVPPMSSAARTSCAGRW